MEGKLGPEQLKLALPNVDYPKNYGILIGPGLGIDAAAVDSNIAPTRAKECYGVKSDTQCALVWKTDPITFETNDPGKYGIIVNLNDLTCLGAIPHSALVTWLLPTSLSGSDFRQLQQRMQDCADEFHIAIIGGHTEFTSAVRTPIVAITMMGYTPLPYLPSRKLSVGDSLYFMGFIGNEGTTILGHKLLQSLTYNPQIRGNLPEEVMKSLQEELPKLDGQLSIHKDGIELNKVLRPSLMHDPTEGGVFGAICELFCEMEVGVQIDSEALSKHLHPLTKAFCEWLSVDPFRLISSGSLLLIVPKEQAFDLEGIQSKLSHKISRIGTIIEDHHCYHGKQVIDCSQTDAIIEALKNFDRKTSTNEEPPPPEINTAAKQTLDNLA